MRRYLRLAVLVAALVVLAVFAAGYGSRSGTSTSSTQGGSAPSKSYDNGPRKKGGTYTVGWEQSFATERRPGSGG